MALLLSLLACSGAGPSLKSDRFEAVVANLSGTEGTASVNVMVLWEAGRSCSTAIEAMAVDLDGTPIPFDRSWGRHARDCVDAAEWRLHATEFPRGPGDRTLTLSYGGEVQVLTIPDPTGARHLSPVAANPWASPPGTVVSFDSPRADFTLEGHATGSLAARHGERTGQLPVRLVASVSDGRVHVRVPEVAAGEYMLSVRSVGRIAVPCFADACWALVTAKAVHPFTVTGG